MSIVATSTGLKLAGARDLGPQFVQNHDRMVGQDGAFSIRLDDAETLWFFGDTLIGTRPADHSIWLIDGRLPGHADMSGLGTYERMINNTGLILPKQTGRNGLKDFRYIQDAQGQMKCLIPHEGDEHPDWDRIWCQHGICLGDKVYLSFIKVRMLVESGPLPIWFRVAGSGLAVGRRGEWNFERILQDGRSVLWREHEPHFGTAFLDNPQDGHVYVYGTVSLKGLHQCYLACVRADEIDKPDRYKYLAGPEPTWSRSIHEAIGIFDRMPSELSVSYNKFLGRFLAVHSLDLSGKIVGRTAPHPWGPWSDPVVLWTARAEHKHPRPYPNDLIYAAKEHPTLAAEDGRVIYLTYIEFEEYFPHLIEVTLAS